MSDTLVKVENVSKKFCRSLKRSLWYGVRDIGAELLGHGHSQNGSQNGLPPLRTDEFWAVQDINFELKRGDCLGLIGRNGAGKSTLLKMLNGLLKPDTGRIEMRGRIGALIELGTGFNPILTGRENVYVNGSVLGFSKKEIDRKFDEVVEFSGVEEFIDMPVKNYSSGMKVRLGFAVAAHLNPDILLIDEVLAVGDLSFQRKCLQHMMKYIKAGGSIILVAHNLHLIQSVCTTGILLEGGRTSFIGSITDTVGAYHLATQKHSKENSSTAPRNNSDTYSPVSIEKISINSNTNETIQTGDTVEISIDIQVNETNIPPVIWGFSFWTGDQWVRIATSTSSWDGYTYQLIKGINRLNCIIPDLPLMSGEYLMKVGIYDAATNWPIIRVGWEDAPIGFSVKAPINYENNRRITDGDILLLETCWSNKPKGGI